MEYRGTRRYRQPVKGRDGPASAETRRAHFKKRAALVLALLTQNTHRCALVVVAVASNEHSILIYVVIASKKHLDEDSPALRGLAWIEDLETVK